MGGVVRGGGNKHPVCVCVCVVSRLLWDASLDLAIHVGASAEVDHTGGRSSTRRSFLHFFNSGLVLAITPLSVCALV